MDIAAMSIGMSLANVQQQSSLIMAKKSMDLQEASTANLLDMMKSAPPMAPGQRLDVRA